MIITVGSLFSGIGGFDLGFENAGMICKWQVEIDKSCRKVLARHWPDVVRFKDVKEVGSHNLEPVDLICGGFPCQDLSIAGKRAGLDGERSGLWWEFARVISELEPKWVVVENVPGLLSSNSGKDFAIILQWLVERGYGVAWRILDSQFFGVPQRRRRVFVVASFGDGRCSEVLFEREGVRWDTTSIQEQGEGVIGTLDRKSTSSDRGSQGNETDFLVIASGQAKAESFSDCSPSITQLHEQPIVLHPTRTGVRRLTPTECSRLQGFPDNWNDFLKDTTRYRQFGNAVTVSVITWIGKRIIACDGDIDDWTN